MLEDNKIIIISILKGIFGEPKSSSNLENRNQWEFNCQSHKCKNDNNKYNLGFNSDKNIYKCWKCGEKGFIHNLIKRYGTRQDVQRINLILPNNINKTDVFIKRQKQKDKRVICPLPQEFKLLLAGPITKMQQIAIDYMTKDRHVSLKQIIKYNIGYAEDGKYRNRIIIPSYNQYGDINYFVSRTFLKNSKLTYFNPDKKSLGTENIPDKYDIIFNENNINWDIPIYLTEGVFDMFRLPNSIPMLGKIPSWYIISKILENNSKVVLCLDEDAISDGIDIYEELESLGINVYFVDLKGYEDISKAFEKGGKKCITKLLKSKEKIDFMYKFNKILN